MRIRIGHSLLSLVVLVFLASPLVAEKPAKGSPTGGEEFFIISSVDMAKKRLLLKHPTEVTELMFVNDKTACYDEKGKSEPCKNLRAGDTIFVSSSGNGEGARTATRIRVGPMTIEEIHRKYVTFQ